MSASTSTSANVHAHTVQRPVGKNTLVGIVSAGLIIPKHLCTIGRPETKIINIAHPKYHMVSSVHDIRFLCLLDGEEIDNSNVQIGTLELSHTVKSNDLVLKNPSGERQIGCTLIGEGMTVYM